MPTCSPVEAQTIGPRTAGDRAVDRQDHASVLERASRVGALELQVQPLEADLGAQASSVDQRRAALAERDRERLAVPGEEGDRRSAFEERLGHGRRV